MLNDEAAMLAAREILKYMDGWGIEFPFEIIVDESPVWMDYDDAAAIIESIISHFFNLEPRNETVPTTFN